jgi:hypothetical protein
MHPYAAEVEELGVSRSRSDETQEDFRAIFTTRGGVGFGKSKR